ncbi:MAG: ABC transporter permease [Caloramator sp.]|nr:ABC transporter permease [Caloramator sp.]
MGKYILKRASYMIFTMFIIVTATFFLMNAMPGDPISQQARKMPPELQKMIRHKYGLDRPIAERWLMYLKQLLHGNFGDSFVTPGFSVNEIIKYKMPASAWIGIQAVILGLLIGIILGIIAAFRRNTTVDYIVIFIAILGVSVPGFVIAFLLQTTLGGKGSIPIAGWKASTDTFAQGFKYTILPTIALCFGSIATYARYMRTSVLDVINQDYILTAQAKGISKGAVAVKHVIRNAIIPIITILGPQIAMIITGTLVIERIFAIPGMGSSMIEAINTNDYNVILGLTIFFSFLYIVSLLLVDITYCLVDPRISLTKKKK